MAESLGGSAKHKGIAGNLTPHMMARNLSLLGRPDNDGTQKHASSETSTDKPNFQAREQLHNVIRGTEESDESISPQKPITNRLSALIHKRISSIGGSAKSHRRVRSEMISQSQKGREHNDELSLRKTHSAVPNPCQNPAKSKPTGPREDIYQDMIGHLCDSCRLDDLLVLALSVERYTNRHFMPRNIMNKLVTQESVNRELSRIEYLPAKILHRTWRPKTHFRVRPLLEHHSAQHAQIAMAHGTLSHPDKASFQQVFTILMLMGCSKKIWSFVKERVCDADLPLTKIRQGGMFELRRYRDPQTPLKCLKKQSDICGFVTHQLCVLAPVFGESDEERLSHYKAWKGQILPFIFWENINRRGGSAEVYKAEIHPDHHTFDKKQIHNNLVAVKRFAINNRNTFNHESNVLQHLRKPCHEHDHLISLLATYEQDEHYHLILPWAEIDLEDFWKLKFPDPSHDPKLSAWLKIQCCGIAGAVSQIHRYNTTSATTMLSRAGSSVPEACDAQSRCESHQSPGQRNPKRLFGRHGDIKPSNILWFPDRNMPLDKISGILKISDFGTARFSENENISVQDRRMIPNSEPYQSPECRLPDGNISTQCDVWALGCVFLEFVCWYTGGRELLENFQHDRTYRYDSSSFFTIRRTETLQSTFAELKQPVVKMLDRLLAENALDSNLTAILTAVRDDMLLILDGDADPEHNNHGTCISPSPNSLGVPQQTRCRRKSCGNISRNLGIALTS